MEIYITNMKKTDIPQVAEIEKEAFSIPWSEGAFEDSLSYDYAVFKVAVDTETHRIVGYVGMYKAFEEGDITNIAVAPEYRHRGIGTMLLKEIYETAREAGIKEIRLEVRESNTAAIELYEKMSFEENGIRKNFYDKPREDAILMVCHVLPL